MQDVGAYPSGYGALMPMMTRTMSLSPAQTFWSALIVVTLTCVRC